jgi:hypothetical protein
MTIHQVPAAGNLLSTDDRRPMTDDRRPSHRNFLSTEN